MISLRYQSSPRALWGLCASLALALCQAAVRAQEAAPVRQRPNVVLVITDDQGYGDLGVHGNRMLRTPNLDRLASESVSLTDYHVDPTCSPSRSALLTGRYSTRTGVWHTIMGRSLMAGAERTMAECFRDAGYRTGMFGKWHLGDNAPCRPQDQGFERVVWHHGGGVGQGPDYWGNNYFDDTYEVDGEWRKFEGYCTDVWFEQAEEFLRREDARPFFVYLATNAPHGPYLVADKYSRPYREMGVAKTMANFYGMIANIDENVGRLRGLLDELGLADNTVFVFTTDNGTAAGHQKRAREQGSWPGFDGGMRGHKGSEYEGGHRVPFFVRWPAGKVGGGEGAGRTIDALLAHVDVLPTLCELCGLEESGQVASQAVAQQTDGQGAGRRSFRGPWDGRSFAAALLGRAELARDRTLFVHSQRLEHPRMWRKSAVMTERWRLVNGRELYDIVADPRQRSDIAGEHVDVVAALRAEYEGWWRSLQPSFADYVRIDLGGREDPVDLMSHDWHTNNGGTPWHQNHVRNGWLGKGPWAVHVREAGNYRVTLWRWPSHLERAMQCVAGEVRFGSASGADVVARADFDPSRTHVSFDMRLPAGPRMLHTVLRRAKGGEHGAYFASIKRLP